MKKSTFLTKLALMIVSLLILSSCVGWKEIGRLNMVSTRNIETSQKYDLIQKYAEHTKKEMKKTRSGSLQEAIDEIVKKVNGGEYLMNAKVYLIWHSNGFTAPKYFYAVEGDVWGINKK